MEPAGKLSRLAALERKIKVTQRMERREISSVETANRLRDINEKKGMEMIGLANKISNWAMEEIDKDSENEMLPEILQNELSQLKSISDTLTSHNHQLNTQKKEMIVKEENLNELIKERFEVREKSKSEVEEKTIAFNFVKEKLDLLDAHKGRMRELHNRLLANVQKFVHTIDI